MQLYRHTYTSGISLCRNKAKKKKQIHLINYYIRDLVENLYLVCNISFHLCSSSLNLTNARECIQLFSFLLAN